MISKKFLLASIASIATAGTLGIAVAQTSSGDAPNLNTPTDNKPASGAGSSQPMDSASGTSGASGAVGASTSSGSAPSADTTAPAAEQPTQADRG
jgi:hypothetical protein